MVQTECIMFCISNLVIFQTKIACTGFTFSIVNVNKNLDEWNMYTEVRIARYNQNNQWCPDLSQSKDVWAIKSHDMKKT